jgi:hypothetical protein
MTATASSVTLRPVTGDWADRVRRYLAATDWAATPVVDVVADAPATTRGLEGGHMRTECYRYAAPPHPSTYATGERACRVERITRPLYERFADR